MTKTAYISRYINTLLLAALFLPAVIIMAIMAALSILPPIFIVVGTIAYVSICFTSVVINAIIHIRISTLSLKHLSSTMHHMNSRMKDAEGRLSDLDDRAKSMASALSFHSRD